MGHGQTGGSGVVRVTVASDSRRVDLALPAVVPVAELLPELARGVGVLDATSAHGGYRLLTHDGRELAAAVGLAAQGIEDGGLLSVCPGELADPPRVYDDVVEAMADTVTRDLGGWSQPAGRRTALAAAAMSLIVGVLGLLVHGGTSAGTAAGLLAVGLLAGAGRLSRVRDGPEAAVVVAWLACGSAAVAALLLAPPGRMLPPIAWAGAGSMLAGVVGLVALRSRRPLVIPPVVVGAVLLATGGVVRVAAVGPADVLTLLVVLLVVAGSTFPSLALRAAGPYACQQLPVGVPTGEVDPVDVDLVGADARAAHELLLGIHATVGLLLVLVAPYAVSLGPWGALTVVSCCLVVAFRTRRHHGGVEVLVGLVSGVLGLVGTGAAVVWSQPVWRPAAAAALVSTGVVLLVVAARSGPPSVRRRWLADVAETVLLIALPPLLVLAVGVVDVVRG